LQAERARFLGGFDNLSCEMPYPDTENQADLLRRRLHPVKLSQIPCGVIGQIDDWRDLSPNYTIYCTGYGRNLSVIVVPTVY
jgi:hypothetical protein